MPVDVGKSWGQVDIYSTVDVDVNRNDVLLTMARIS